MSVGNILIYDGDRASPPIGLLSDWDLAKTQQQIFNLRPSQSSRSGTWQFMSATLQAYPWKPHLLPDDLKSIMHILSWLALRTCYDDANGSECSSWKFDCVEQGIPFFKVRRSEDERHPFVQLARMLSKLCERQYSTLNPAEYTQNPEVLIAVCRMAWQQSRTDGQNNLSAVGSSAIQQDVAPQPGRAPLITHDAMLGAFDEVLEGEKYIDWSGLDKAAQPIGTSGISLSSSHTISASGVKRPGDESKDSEAEQPKPKRAHAASKEGITSASTHSRAGGSSATTSKSRSGRTK
ncbi:hypothetical protein BN946_scf184845.g27 [Trametes cinnabarina]|uniref:Fungal-type protein kinase domain-containing protein n=1 Tax=Pycnoporus cinnabarinus TaxID=5643 RepID=A0A060S9H7_PYCCI|nr:hypothetical protein BN946_scf184845.g27 [Trametes cinnabarina]